MHYRIKQLNNSYST